MPQGDINSQMSEGVNSVTDANIFFQTSAMSQKKSKDTDYHIRIQYCRSHLYLNNQHDENFIFGLTLLWPCL
jgi:hypothetical protein